MEALSKNDNIKAFIATKMKNPISLLDNYRNLLYIQEETFIESIVI